MLHEFLQSNRSELIARCRAKAAKRALPRTLPVDSYGIPQFLEQLIETFRVEQTPEAMARHKALGPGKPSLALVPSDIPGTAGKHGDEMRQQGVPIDQVVHGYGDLCQALTELALERNVLITVDEFHTFNRCLDDAIADAVTCFSHNPATSSSKPDVDAVNELRLARVQVIRTLIETALQSFAAIKSGSVGVNGTTAAMHERSLYGLRDLVDRLLADAGAVGTPAAKKGHSPS